MKITCLPASARFLAISLVLAAGDVAWAQVASPVNIDTPNGAAGPISAQSPAQSIVNSASPAPVAVPWYNALFQQKLPVEFGFKLGESHSDNIFYQPIKTSDYITEIIPSLTFTLGHPIPLAPQLNQETIDDEPDAEHTSYLQLSYHPTVILYARDSSLDDVDEYANAIFSHQFSRLTLSIEQTYEKLSQPTVQINAQGTLIHRDIYTTTAKANYIYSDQLSTYGTLTQTWNNYIGEGYTDNTEWTADYYFLYQLFPKLSLGLGPRIGFDDIELAPNQAFQAGLIHLKFDATSKFTLGGAAGAEIREYEHDAAAEKVTPIVEGYAIYQPFDSMTISLDGERHRIVSNGQPGTDYTASVAALEISQRFFQVSYLKLAAGYEDDQYTMLPGVGGPARDDQIFYLRGGLEWKSYRGLTVDASYGYLRNESNVKIFRFNENRVTISASFIY